MLRSSQRTAPLLVLCAALWCALGAIAQTPAFTAQYQISQASQDSSGNVQLTFSASVSNNGAADIGNATVSVANPAANQTFGSFQNVSVAAGGSAQVSGSLALPLNIYNSWQTGGSPRLNLDYTDANGNPVHVAFQATAAPPAGSSL